jgi:hypothetical protein
MNEKGEAESIYLKAPQIKKDGKIYAAPAGYEKKEIGDDPDWNPNTMTKEQEKANLAKQREDEKEAKAQDEYAKAVLERDVSQIITDSEVKSLETAAAEKKARLAESEMIDKRSTAKEVLSRAEKDAEDRKVGSAETLAKAQDQYNAARKSEEAAKAATRAIESQQIDQDLENAKSKETLKAYESALKLENTGRRQSLVMPTPPRSSQPTARETAPTTAPVSALPTGKGMDDAIAASKDPDIRYTSNEPIARPIMVNGRLEKPLRLTPSDKAIAQETQYPTTIPGSSLDGKTFRAERKTGDANSAPLGQVMMPDPAGGQQETDEDGFTHRSVDLSKFNGAYGQATRSLIIKADKKFGDEPIEPGTDITQENEFGAPNARGQRIGTNIESRPSKARAKMQNVPLEWTSNSALTAQANARDTGTDVIHTNADINVEMPENKLDAEGALKVSGKQVGVVRRTMLGVPEVELSPSAFGQTSSPSYRSSDPFKGAPEYAAAHPSFREQNGLDSDVKWRDQRWSQDQFSEYMENWKGSGDAERRKLMDSDLLKDMEGEMPDAGQLYRQGRISLQQARQLDQEVYGRSQKLPDYNESFTAWKGGNTPAAAKLREIETAGVTDYSDRELEAAKERVMTEWEGEYRKRHGKQPDFDPNALVAARKAIAGTQSTGLQKFIAGAEDIGSSVIGSSAGLIELLAKDPIGKNKRALADKPLIPQAKIQAYEKKKAAGLELNDEDKRIGYMVEFAGGRDLTFDEAASIRTPEEIDLITTKLASDIKALTSKWKEADENPALRPVIPLGARVSGGGASMSAGFQSQADKDKAIAEYLDKREKGQGNVLADIDLLKEHIDNNTLTPSLVKTIGERIKAKGFANTNGKALAKANPQLTPEELLESGKADRFDITKNTAAGALMAAYEETRDERYIEMLKGHVYTTDAREEVVEAAARYASMNGYLQPSDSWGAFNLTRRGIQVDAKELLIESLGSAASLGITKALNPATRIFKAAGKAGTAATKIQKVMSRADNVLNMIQNSKTIAAIKDIGESYSKAGIKANAPTMNAIISKVKEVPLQSFSEGLQGASAAMFEEGKSAKDITDAAVLEAAGGGMMAMMNIAPVAALSATERMKNNMAQQQASKKWADEWNSINPDNPITPADATAIYGLIDKRDLKQAKDRIRAVKDALDAQQGPATPEQSQEMFKAMFDIHNIEQVAVQTHQELEGIGDKRMKAFVKAGLRTLTGQPLTTEDQKALGAVNAKGEPLMKMHKGQVVFTNAGIAEVSQAAPDTFGRYFPTQEEQQELAIDAEAELAEEQKKRFSNEAITALPDNELLDLQNEVNSTLDEQKKGDGTSMQTNAGTLDAKGRIDREIERRGIKPAPEQSPAESPAEPTLATSDQPTSGDGGTSVDKAAHDAASSPTNSKREPTPDEIEAGNYAKGHPTIGGIKISIENPAGSTRRSKPGAPKPWATPMVKAHYGYIRGTVGADGDQIDVFVKEGTPEDFDGMAFVIPQRNPDGSFDEHKVMIGYASAEEAKAAYKKHYEKGWQGYRPSQAVRMSELASMVKSGKLKKPNQRQRTNEQNTNTPIQSQQPVLQTPNEEQGQQNQAAEGSTVPAPADGVGETNAATGTGGSNVPAEQTAGPALPENDTTSNTPSEQASAATKAEAVWSIRTNKGRKLTIPASAASTTLEARAIFSKMLAAEKRPLFGSREMLVLGNGSEVAPLAEATIEQQVFDIVSGIVNKTPARDKQLVMHLGRLVMAGINKHRKMLGIAFSDIKITAEKLDGGGMVVRDDTLIISPSTLIRSMQVFPPAYIESFVDTGFFHEALHPIIGKFVSPQKSAYFWNALTKEAQDAFKMSYEQGKEGTLIKGENQDVKWGYEYLRALIEKKYNARTSEELFVVAGVRAEIVAAIKKVVEFLLDIQKSLKSGVDYDLIKEITDSAEQAIIESGITTGSVDAQRNAKAAKAKAQPIGSSALARAMINEEFGAMAKALGIDIVPNYSAPSARYVISEDGKRRGGYIEINPVKIANWSPGQMKEAMREEMIHAIEDRALIAELMKAGHKMSDSYIQSGDYHVDFFNGVYQMMSPEQIAYVKDIYSSHGNREHVIGSEFRRMLLQKEHYNGLTESAFAGKNAKGRKAIDAIAGLLKIAVKYLKALATTNTPAGKQAARIYEESRKALQKLDPRGEAVPLSMAAPQSDHLKAAAVQYEDNNGEVWQYSSVRGHAAAEQKLHDALGFIPDYKRVKDGFVTYGGKFLARDAAYRQAIKTNQYVDRGQSKGQLIADEVRGLAPQGFNEDGSIDMQSMAGPLVGLPSKVKIPGIGEREFGPFQPARDTAAAYMKSAGLEYDPPRTYAKVNKDRAERIAAAFDAMKHDPQDPKVAAAYKALIDETVAQWEAIKKTGLRVSPMKKGMADPYAASPRMAQVDVEENNHLWFYPTDFGFGNDVTGFDPKDNPLFEFTGEVINGHKMRANDVFRIVHDYFGHFKEGVGFRADGEENAWRQHAAMFSDLARGALTTETRGQNSWLNFGPYGEKNRTARVEDTVFADQKIGLMPDWTWKEGLADPVSGGAAFAKFFNETQTTKDGGATFKDAKEILQRPLEGYESELQSYLKFGSNFQKHIMASIPGFLDVRIRAMRGMAEAAVILGRKGKEVAMLDITSSEGYFTKAWAEQAQARGVNATADALDALPAFKDGFEATPQVKGVRYLLEAWGESFVDPTTNQRIPQFKANKKYAIVHEGMGFQFFTPTRDAEIAEVKSMMSPGGLFVTMQKLKNEDYKKREVLKDEYKARFFSKKQIDDKAATVLNKSDENAVGMSDYQFDRLAYEKILKKHFRNVTQIWSSGNFAGYYATDSDVVMRAALDNTGETTTKFNEEATPRHIAGVQSMAAPMSKPYVASAIRDLGNLSLEEEGGDTMNLDGSKYTGGGVAIPVLSKNVDDYRKLKATDIGKFINPENIEYVAAGGSVLKAGIYKFPNSTKASIDLNIIAPREKRDEGVKIAGELGQESAFDLDTFENIKTGQDGMNPRKPTVEEVREIAQRLSMAAPQAAPRPGQKVTAYHGTPYSFDKPRRSSTGFWLTMDREQAENGYARGGEVKQFTVDTTGFADLTRDAKLAKKLIKDYNNEADVVDEERQIGNDPEFAATVFSGTEAESTLRSMGYTGAIVWEEPGMVSINAFDPDNSVQSMAAPQTELALGKKGDADFLRQKNVKRIIDQTAKRHPEAKIVNYIKDGDKFRLDEKGFPLAQPEEYNLSESTLAKSSMKGLRGEARIKAYERALAEKLKGLYDTIKDQPDVMAGKEWYRVAREKLVNVFGDDTMLFSQLLAATSARTPVQQNFEQAIDAFNGIFYDGRFNGMTERYLDAMKSLEAGELRFRKSIGNNKMGDVVTPKSFREWLDIEGVMPRRENGKKYNANSMQVLNVIAGVWREKLGGPKTAQFSDNLSGASMEATVDVWAARTLHRMSNEQEGARWRILPEAETGVNNEDFAIGQAAFKIAASELGMNPDDLQGVLWFAEKRHWAGKGWTRAAGAELSDFSSLLDFVTTEGGKKVLRIDNRQGMLDFDETTNTTRAIGPETQRIRSRATGATKSVQGGNADAGSRPAQGEGRGSERVAEQEQQSLFMAAPSATPEQAVKDGFTEGPFIHRTFAKFSEFDLNAPKQNRKSDIPAVYLTNPGDNYYRGKKITVYVKPGAKGLKDITFALNQRAIEDEDVEGAQTYNQSKMELVKQAIDEGYNGTKYNGSTYFDNSSEIIVFDPKNTTIIQEPQAMAAPAVPGLTETTIQGKLAKTGVPITFNYFRNADPFTKKKGKPAKDEWFDRGYEPSGRYMNADEGMAAEEMEGKDLYGNPSTSSKTERGTVTFNNPLVIEFDEYGTETSWKQRLSAAYGGATGKRLSKKIIASGYDGIITVDSLDSSGSPLAQENRTASEIVDLTTFDESKALYMAGPNLDPQRASFVEPGFYSELGRTIAAKMPNSMKVIPASTIPGRKTTERTITGKDGKVIKVIKATNEPDRKIEAKGIGEQMKAMLLNADVTPDELKWSGLLTWLDGRDSVTKAEVEQYLRDEGQVRFVEVELSDNAPTINEMGMSMFGVSAPELTPEQLMIIGQNSANGLRSPKYASHVLPGGSKYREVVLAMPTKAKIDNTVYHVGYATRDGSMPGSTIPFNTRKEAQSFIDSTMKGASIFERARTSGMSWNDKTREYTSSHFRDVPNYLAHTRLNERTDSAGKNGLFIEELQSDRHQAGRREGYKMTSIELQRLKELNEKWEDSNRGPEDVLNNDEYAEWERLANAHDDEMASGSAIPDAPFRQSSAWGLQLFKRALRDAVESGKEWIGWTVGDTQNDRFGLEKHFSEIILQKPFSDDRIYIDGRDQSGRRIVDKVIQPSELAEHVGEELAAKFEAMPWKPYSFEQSNGAQVTQDSKRLKGLDLKTGGEGMRGFYDTIMPREIAKYVKQWGAGVVKGEINGTPAINETGQIRARMGGFEETTPIWRVDITPQMRQSIANEGQALFMAGPRVESPEAARESLEAWLALPATAEELRMLREKALSEETGKRTVGDPQRAGLFGSGDMENRERDVIIQFRKNNKTPEKVIDWMTEGQGLAESDPDLVMDALLDNFYDGVGYDSPQHVFAAGIVVSRMFKEARLKGDSELLRKAQALAYADGAARSENARVLRSMVDPHRTPEERMNEFFAKLISTPSEFQRIEIDKAPSPLQKEREIAELKAQIEELKKQVGNQTQGPKVEQKKKLEKTLDDVSKRKDRKTLVDEYTEARRKAVADALKREGLSEEDIFVSPEERMAAHNSDPVQEAIAQHPKEHREAINYILRGYSHKDISSMTKLPVNVVATIHQEFRQKSMRQSLSKWVKGGKTLFDTIQNGLKKAFGMSMAAPVPYAQAKSAGSIIAEAEIERQLNVLVPTAQQVNSGKMVAVIVDGKNGQEVTIKVPFTASDFRSAYRVGRAISASESNAFDKIYEYWISFGLLSGPETHWANVMGNAGMLFVHLFAQKPMEAAINFMMRDPNSVQLGEFKQMVNGIIPGVRDAFALAALAWDAEADPIGATYMNETIDLKFDATGNLSKVGTMKGPAIKGIKGRVFRVSTRFLLAMDAFFKAITANIEVGARAYRLGKMAQSNGTLGATRGDLEAFIAQQVATPGSESWELAMQTAKELAFQGDNWLTLIAGSLTARNQEMAIANLSKDVIKASAKGDANEVFNAKFSRASMMLTGFVMKFIFPFVKTPTNIIRTGARKAGLGVIGLPFIMSRVIYKGLKNKINGKDFHDGNESAIMITWMAEQVQAAAMWMYLWSIAEGDDDDNEKPYYIVGSRPYGTTKQGEREAAYSKSGGTQMVMVRNDDGTYTPYPYGRYEPFATVLTTVVDTMREIKNANRLNRMGLPGGSNMNVMTNSIASFASQLQDKSFFQGFANVTKAIEKVMNKKGGELATDTAKGFLQGFVPNIVRQPLRNTDPIVRDSKKAEAAYAAIPMGRFAEPLIDFYGRESEKLGTSASRLLIRSASKPQDFTKAEEMIERWNLLHPDKKYQPSRLSPSDLWIYGPNKERRIITDNKLKTEFEVEVGQEILRRQNELASSIEEFPDDFDNRLTNEARKARDQVRKDFLSKSLERQQKVLK